MVATGFKFTEVEVEQVLREYALRVVNEEGQSLPEMAKDLVTLIDSEKVERAAMKGGDDVDAQTMAALEEIKAILVELEVLEF